MSKLKNIFTFLIIILILAFLFFILTRRSNNVDAEILDSFAQCLAAKNITMYGAAWCRHCQNEKAAFGESFKYVPYVECPQEINKCLALGISGYPTWVFPASPAGGPDGKRLEGEQGLENLSQQSGCPLNQP